MRTRVIEVIKPIVEDNFSYQILFSYSKKLEVMILLRLTYSSRK